MQRSALCRSRRELSNEYLLAKIGVVTAENEPLEVWGKIIQYISILFIRVFSNDSAKSDLSKNAFSLKDPWKSRPAFSHKIADSMTPSYKKMYYAGCVQPVVQLERSILYWPPHRKLYKARSRL